MTGATDWPFAYSYAKALPMLQQPQRPEAPSAPVLIAFNHVLAEQLGLPTAALDDAALAALFSGAQLPPGASPSALAYAGQQFGHFVPQLGDGRALLLGEVLTPNGARFDMQLKGSGRTPFSRGGDGKAALGPVLREYLMSEAMHALGIPTSRALAAVLTGDEIWREGALPGAVLTRIAASHIRIGTVQYAAAHHGPEVVRALCYYTLQRHFPHALGVETPCLTLFEHVIAAQAALVARWMGVGFVHGVMNTDNVTLSGETIDYGPAAFLDDYAAEAVFSAIDRHGRYAFGRQAAICHWNLAQLGSAIAAAVVEGGEGEVADIQDRVDAFPALSEAAWLDVMRGKLGLTEARDGDRALVDALFDAMEGQGVDFTLLFARLTDGEMDRAAALFADATGFLHWLGEWQQRQSAQTGGSTAGAEKMRAANPRIIPRHYQIERVIAAARGGDFAPFHTMLAAVTQPFADTPVSSQWSAPPAQDLAPTQTFCGT